MRDEKRSKKRNDVKDGALVSFSAHELSGFAMIGWILDINEAGLGLRYVDLGDQSNGSSKIEIFGCLEPAIHIHEIPCKIVYDVPEPHHNAGEPLRRKTRRCGIRFGKLTQNQMLLLAGFIQHYTTNGEDSSKCDPFCWM